MKINLNDLDKFTDKFERIKKKKPQSWNTKSDKKRIKDNKNK